MKGGKNREWEVGAAIANVIDRDRGVMLCFQRPGKEFLMFLELPEARELVYEMLTLIARIDEEGT